MCILFYRLFCVYSCGLPTSHQRFSYLILRRVTMTSKVKVAMSRGAFYTCWPLSRERKVSKTSKLIGWLTTLRAITRTRWEVKRSKVKVTSPINAKTESVSPIRTSNLSVKFGYCMCAGAYRVGRTRRLYNLLLQISSRVGGVAKLWCLAQAEHSVWVIN